MGYELPREQEKEKMFKREKKWVIMLKRDREGGREREKIIVSNIGMLRGILGRRGKDKD